MDLRDLFFISKILFVKNQRKEATKVPIRVTKGPDKVAY